LKEKIKELKRKKDDTLENVFLSPKKNVADMRCDLCAVTYRDADHKESHCAGSEHLLNEQADRGTNKEALRKEEEELGLKFPTFPLACLICDKEFKKKREFLTHHRRHHSHMRPYSCTSCPAGDSFFRRCDLLQHLRTHLGMSSFKCQECGKGFQQESKLTSHLIHDHQYMDNRPRRYKCTECEKLFITKTEVEHHMNVHTSLSKFYCHHCQKGFSSHQSLMAHQRLHSGEYAFSCDMCKFKCNNRGNLTIHKRIHTGEKPFKCTVCSYVCSASSRLKRHMNQHLVEKPYRCPYCNYSAACINNLRSHIKKTKKHKGLLMYPCKFCSFASDAAETFVDHMKQEHGSIEEGATKMAGMIRCSSTSNTVTITDQQQQEQQEQQEQQQQQHHGEEENHGGDGVFSGENQLAVDGVTSHEPSDDDLGVFVAGESGDVIYEVKRGGEGDNQQPLLLGQDPTNTIDVSLFNAIIQFPNLQKIIIPQGDLPLTLIFDAAKEDGEGCRTYEDAGDASSRVQIVDDDDDDEVVTTDTV